RSRSSRLVLLFSTILTIISATTYIIYLLTSPTQPVFQCGSTFAEAKALGCHFDIMSFSWLPTPCFDSELMNEFLNVSDWKWYTSHGGQSTVPKERVLAGEYDQLWVTWEYHRVHCTYMWKKLHRAILTDDVHVDGYIANMHHTHHCSMVLLEGDVPRMEPSTAIQAKIPSCGRGALHAE
ncbi:hypothetical protein BO78DRAFT_272572, partial [Aspergillus sclerotiicarbonarius CBS 121057]